MKNSTKQSLSTVSIGTNNTTITRSDLRQLLHHYRRHVATFTAFIGLGLASWLLTNATYVELSVFLQQLPERYRISAYAILALESANVYPLLYLLLNGQEQALRQSSVIWWILGQAVLVATLMSVFWAKTVTILGSSSSVAMLILTHFGGMVSTTSSVVFYPFAATYPPVYTSALATGEGLSGSLVAVLGIVQNPGNALRFSVSVFYLLCATITCGSIAAFAFLQTHPWAKDVQMSPNSDDKTIQEPTQEQRHGLEDKERQEEEDTLLTLTLCNSVPSYTSTSIVSTFLPNLSSSSGMTTSRTEVFRQVWPLLACQWILAAFSYGWLPSTMPYVYKKFASRDDAETATTARLQTTASIAALILSPLASISTTWIRLYCVRSMTLALVLLASLLLSFSLTSKPMLSDHIHGYLLPLLVHTFYLVGCAYTQTMLYLTLKRTAEVKHSTEITRQVYQWNGLATQLGAMSGTAITFPLVFWYESLFIA